MATLRFRMADQRFFAKLSGDFNPVHLDPIVARRIASGEPIVHGVHLLLRALDSHFSTASAPPRLALSATFFRAAVLNEAIRIDRSNDGVVRLAMNNGVTLAEAAIGALPPAAGPSGSAGTGRRGPAPRRPPIATVRTLPDVVDAHGELDLPSAASVRRAFPRASRALGSDAVAAIVAISNLVGMECPGRDSLLSAVRLELTPHTHARRLTWNVIRADRRFGLVRIRICAGGMAGTVDAFLRTPPPPPPTIASVAARVAAGEFAGQRALVIGGSRGLGATTALLLACGGGVPIVTYAAGAADAEALRRDAGAAGLALEILPFDIVADKVDRIADAAARFGVTHLYYFATPRIFVRRQPPFDSAVFERFAAFYVSGFARVCEAVRSVVPSLDVFYPSTTAIDEGHPELTEYAAAKAAGETLCRVMTASTPGLRILVRRLPRVTTDQTASIMAARALDPIDALLPVIRDMHSRVGGGLR
jgi:NAD(P)-dependent dehydrogenase (short-subunit alcohol dehydrogenase family)